jgi:hypothetical protein
MTKGQHLQFCQLRHSLQSGNNRRNALPAQLTFDEFQRTDRLKNFSRLLFFVTSLHP